MVVIIHVILLHETGSSSKIFTRKLKNKFIDFYLFKDSLNLFLYFLFILLVLISPWFLGDPENFIEANNLSSPIHIKPEWYFLWAYAILRAIPSKVGGVLALFSAVLILYSLSLKNKIFSRFYINTFLFFILIFLFLTFLGGCPVEAPYIVIRQVFSFLYFFIFLIIYCIHL